MSLWNQWLDNSNSFSLLQYSPGIEMANVASPQAISPNFLCRSGNSSKLMTLCLDNVLVCILWLCCCSKLLCLSKLFSYFCKYKEWVSAPTFCQSGIHETKIWVNYLIVFNLFILMQINTVSLVQSFSLFNSLLFFPVKFSKGILVVWFKFEGRQL